LGRKDKLYTNLARAKRTRDTFFDVIPKFYILPRDRQELKQYAAAHPDQLYIQKVSTGDSLQGMYRFMIMQHFLGHLMGCDQVRGTHDLAAKVQACAGLASSASMLLYGASLHPTAFAC